MRVYDLCAQKTVGEIIHVSHRTWLLSVRTVRSGYQPEMGPWNFMNNLQPWPFVSFSEERVPSFQQLVRGLTQKTLLRIPGLADRVGTLAHWGAGTGTQGSFPHQRSVFQRSILSEGNPSHPTPTGTGVGDFHVSQQTFPGASGLGRLGTWR